MKMTSGVKGSIGDQDHDNKIGKYKLKQLHSQMQYGVTTKVPICKKKKVLFMYKFSVHSILDITSVLILKIRFFNFTSLCVSHIL